VVDDAGQADDHRQLDGLDEAEDRVGSKQSCVVT
jgi:hypothetical protein